MKALKIFFVLSLVCLEAFAFNGHDNFRIDMVKPMGEFGYRVLGRGVNIAELHFDCSRADDMGIVLTTVNKYGKSSSVVLPSKKLGSDKFTCQQSLKKYFAGVYSKRSVASLNSKSGDHGTVELNFDRGGFLSSEDKNKSLILR